MSALAIIPARGGSKRIPRKNIRMFMGKPVIAHSIEKAIQSELFDEVMVSTDDDEIAEIASQYGAQVPFKRSEANSNDTATTLDVIEEVISKYRDTRNKVFNKACCIYPCSPLIKVSDLKKSFLILRNESASSSFPIVEFTYPIWRSLRLEPSGSIKMNWPENLNLRSQDLPKAFHDAGMFYWFDVNDLTRTRDLLHNAKPLILSEMDVQDIDNEIDWSLAELKWRIQNASV